MTSAVCERVLVELHGCNHPPPGPKVARSFNFMAKGWKQVPLVGPRKFVGLEVAEPDVDSIDEIAQRSGRNRSAVIREAITRYLDDDPLEAA